MPTYVYRCTRCEKQFEIEQRIVEDALTHCDTCNAETLKRVIQPVGVAFKGSGFYVNDSRAASPTTSSAPEKAESSAPESATPEPAKTAEAVTPSPAPAAAPESKPSV